MKVLCFLEVFLPSVKDEEDKYSDLDRVFRTNYAADWLEKERIALWQWK